MTKETKSRFLKVKCNDCGNEQAVFSNASTTVKCLACEKVIAEPRGGKAGIKAEIVEVLDSNILG